MAIIGAVSGSGAKRRFSKFGRTKRMNSANRENWQCLSRWLDELLNLPEEQRESRLTELDCDSRTREELGQLLVAARRSSHFLEHSPRIHAVPAAQLISPGTRIGAYRIDAFLARGGMGEVYRARRADGQFEKPVAFKLARGESPLGAARFHNERQILATLEHPGIARLIDGGLTHDGRPYMVMELVEGSDILSYCRTYQLGLEQRLSLFKQVCEAAEYAHRHLVVHCDLKPNNILVTDEGRVKLLDFGIAKLLSTSATPQEQVTLAMMTPDFAAPEQLEGKPATTATDIYSLGVLLYHLLSGSAPWDLRKLPLPAALQRLLHTQPEPLSRAAQANTRSPVPAKLLAGDLDAIVAKALRSEPDARYISCLALWHDLQCHLSHRPVLARGDARGYLVRRFMRRNRLWVGATAAIFMSLITGMAGTLWQAREAREKAHQSEVARDRALAEASRVQSVVDYLDLMFGAAAENPGSRSLSAKEMLDASADQLVRRFADKPAEQARVLQTLGDLYLTLHDYEGAAPVLSRFLDSRDAGANPEARAHIQFDLASVEFNRGNVDSAQRLLSEAQSFWAHDPERYHGQIIHSRSIEAQIQAGRGDLAAAVQTLRGALNQSTALNGETAEDTMTLAGDLGVILMLDNQLQEADQLMTRAWRVLQTAGRERSEEGMTLLNNIAVNAIHRNDLPRAEKLLRQVIDLRKQSFGPSAALAMQENNLAKVLLRSARPHEAIPWLQEALPMSQRFSGDHSQDTVRVSQTAAEAQLTVQDIRAAEPLVQISVDGARAAFGEQSPIYGNGLTLLARLRLLQHRTDEAKRLADAASRTLSAAGDVGKYYLPQLQELQAMIATR
jgi:eukaryotic-like serine/threonine-protein kinase